MRAIHKRITHEDKFARDFHCNSDRFTSDMKRRNRKRMRRLLKEKDKDEIDKVQRNMQGAE